jgi:SAM-dependent methyltransferase
VHDDFYRAIQARFEGSADVQRKRLLGYLPFVYPLLHNYPQAPVLDLNDGASPWLQLLGEVGFNATSLNVHAPELLTQLAQQPDQSQAIVSAFRLVEYLPFDDVRQVVQESLRILKPGGLLILEAPNPENLVLGAGGYYAIPNRQPPVMPELLEFVPQYYGYARTKLVRRLDRLQLGGEAPVQLLNVLNAVSPAYAVIAQKSTDGMSQTPVIPAFTHDYGLKLETLTERFDQQIQQIKADAAATELKLETAIKELEDSLLWKLSRPIRWADNQGKRLADEGVGERISAFKEKFTRIIVQRVLRLFAAKPALQRFCHKVSNKLGLTHYFVSLGRVVEPKVIPVEIDPQW